MSNEEKKEYEELKSLLYSGTLTQYGKRKLIGIIEKQSKEIEELKEDRYGLEEEVQIQAKQLIEIDGNYISKEEYKNAIETTFKVCNKHWKDKIKAVIEEIKSRKITNEEIKQAIIAVLQSFLEKE